MPPNARSKATSPLSDPFSARELKAFVDLPTMDELFRKHLPTKQGHNYNPLYERHFSRIRADVRRVLEIGVEAGTSLRLWRDYFPNADIIGFDINERCAEHEDDRINIVIGDQSNEEDLSNIPGDIDIVVDDGWHTQDSQISCFKYLYRSKMSDGGIYVVEDIVGGMRTIDFFNNLARLLNIWPSHLPGSQWFFFNSGQDFGEALDEYSDEEQYYIINTIGVSIYRHIVFVDKGRNPEDGQASFRLNHPDLAQQMDDVRAEWLKQAQ